MKNFVKSLCKPIQHSVKSSISLSTIYMYGSPQDRQYGNILFKTDGSLEGYVHENEHRWKIDDNQLLFINSAGKVTGRLDYIGSPVWVGKVENKKFPLSLIPLLSIESKINNNFNCSGFLINTIPKAGTYFLEAVLSALGASSLRLHLSGNDIVDDYRGLSDDEIHRDPERVRVKCPLELITAVLNGNTVVGHIEFLSVLNKAREQGNIVFNLYRNLRDVLVSLYRFKLKKVKSLGGGDDYWRTVGDENRFLAFLIFYAERDIAHVKKVAETILSDRSSLRISYEDMCAGHLSSETINELEKIQIGFSGSIISQMSKLSGSQTPTYSGHRSDWTQYWNSDVEAFFISSGLIDINKKLGYEKNN